MMMMMMTHDDDEEGRGWKSYKEFLSSWLNHYLEQSLMV